jgi:hypothetical protein
VIITNPLTSQNWKKKNLAGTIVKTPKYFGLPLDIVNIPSLEKTFKFLG